MWPRSVVTRISRPSALQLMTFPPSVVSGQVCRRSGKVVTYASSRPLSHDVNATNCVSGEKTPKLLDLINGESVVVVVDHTRNSATLDSLYSSYFTSMKRPS